MKTINDWRFVKDCKGFYVIGVTGKHHISTSRVVDYASINGELISIKTKSGSVYHLGDMDPSFAEYANRFGADQFLPIPDCILKLTPLQVPTHGVLPDENFIWSVERVDNGMWKGYAVEDRHCMVRFTESIAPTLEEARDNVIDKMRRRISSEGNSPRSSVGLSVPPNLKLN